MSVKNELVFHRVDLLAGQDATEPFNISQLSKGTGQTWVTDLSGL